MKQFCYLIPLAVDSLQRGQTDDAIETFVLVLNAISKTLSAAPPGQCHCHQNDRNVSLAIFGSAVPLDADSNDENAATATNDYRTSPAVECFKHPFLVSCSPHGCCLSEDHMSCVSAVCLYNLALIYCTRKKASAFNFRKSMNLFERAFNVIPATAMAKTRSVIGHQVEDNNASLLLLRAAVCNNIAALQYEFGDLDQVRAWGARFCSTMSEISNTDTETSLYGEPIFRSLWAKGILDSFAFSAARAA